MDEPDLAAATPTSFLHRAFHWWLAHLKHVLAPTVFFSSAST
jgi:hypothetical protein